MFHPTQFLIEAEPIESVQERVLETVTATQQDVLQSIDGAGQAVFDGLRRTQSKISDFVAERIRQDLDTQSALLRCQSLDEVHEVQTRFMQTALRQYSDAAVQLTGIGREVAERTIASRPLLARSPNGSWELNAPASPKASASA